MFFLIAREDSYLADIAESAPEDVKKAALDWIENMNKADESKVASEALAAALEGYDAPAELADKVKFVKDRRKSGTSCKR